MRSGLYFEFALRIQLPSANEKIRIFRCVQSRPLVGYKLSRAVLGTRMVYILTFTKWLIDSCQNRIPTDQYHMTISPAHVSTH